MLDEELGVEPGARLRELEKHILGQDPRLDLGTPTAEPVAATADVRVTGCPYKGLARYEAADAAVFRGRDRLVRALVTTLVDHRLLVVSGSSGAGKSSVVRAGLLPALQSGELSGSAGWEPVVVVPGARPVDSLARAHRRAAADDAGACSCATSSSSCGRQTSPRANGPPSWTPCWACWPTTWSLGACLPSGATTWVGWPSTRRSPSTCTAAWCWCLR